MYGLIAVLLPSLIMSLAREKLYGADKPKNVILRYILSYLFNVFILNSLCAAAFYKYLGSIDSFFSKMNGDISFFCRYCFVALIIAGALLFVEYVLRKKISKHIDFDSIGYINVGIIIYAAILIALNFVRCFDNSVWGDEGFSIMLAIQPLKQAIEITANDVHPPLYYIILRLAYLLFGNNCFIWHVTSLLPYVLIVFIAVFYIRKEYGSIACLVMMTFVSLSNSSLTFNVEIRMYSWANLFIILSYLFLHKIIVSNKPKWWIAFFVMSLAAMYTHYYALIAIAILYFSLWILGFQKKVSIKNVLIVSISAVIAYLPWLFIFFASCNRTIDSWWNQKIPSVHDCIISIFDYTWLAWVALIILILYILKATQVIEPSGNILNNKITIKVNPPCLVFSSELLWFFAGLLMCFGTAAIGLACSYIIRPLFLVRYLFPLSAVIYLLLGIMISKLHFRKTVCCLLLIAFLIPGIINYKSVYLRDKAIDQSTSAFLDANDFDENDVILTNSSHHAWTILRHYYPNTESIYITDINEVDIQDDSKQYYLLLSTDTNDDTINALDKKGMIAEELYSGSLGSANNVIVYKID